MTEDEAKTKWCPFARYIAEVSPGWAADGTLRAATGNRGGWVDANEVRCIGSACMAWRRHGAKFKDGRTGQLSDRDMTGNGSWIEEGYCGLAGAPQ